jgi:REP-associated tyrosine transposase
LFYTRICHQRDLESVRGNEDQGSQDEHTQACNRRRKRVGHLFQERYKAILVEKESHLLELCRYVVLNPLRIKGKAKIEH